ncbi:hypothetical protein PSTG_15586 [Puccinia striiformis f. sp. tritici PST-78]|uniref:Uncharacterized protein n=1 Tax=Puccinia striiformis f. sp. tritici PST-78 TaxID=1165861 RepID=A0A0L0UVC6_9BASI|nr:hypothetical protein PSTG_15586 [Puccinia striiformis f. sp. tritici PST-78]
METRGGPCRRVHPTPLTDDGVNPTFSADRGVYPTPPVHVGVNPTDSVDLVIGPTRLTKITPTPPTSVPPCKRSLTSDRCRTAPVVLATTVQEENNNLASSPLRLIEQDQSAILSLPTLTQIYRAPESDIQSEPRRILALPSRAHTPFKLSKPQPSPKLQSTQPIDLAQLTRSPLANKHINSLPETTFANHGDHITSPKQLPTAPARQETNKIIFPTPSAAISDIFKAQEDRPIIPNQQETTQPTAGRFTDVHGKQFAKYDSITNHYAAKRKIEARTIPGRSVDNPCKRAQVSDFGYPKPILELARSRRRTGARTSTLGSKLHSKPPSSGFGSFGTRLIKSAVRTVSGAFKASENGPGKVNGVGFGVPAGLGVEPAEVPVAGSSQPERTIAPPTRMVSKPPLSRLPPAGHHRLTPPNTNSISEAACRRVIAGPPTSGLTVGSATTRAQAQTTWRPKTLPKPPPAGIARPGSFSNTQPNLPRTRRVTQHQILHKNPNLNRTTSSSIINPRSRIPTINGLAIIRPTVKTVNNDHDQVSKRGMMNSTPTTCSSSTKSVIKIGLSSETISQKLL